MFDAVTIKGYIMIELQNFTIRCPYNETQFIDAKVDGQDYVFGNSPLFIRCSENATIDVEFP